MVAPDWSAVILGIDVGQSRLHAVVGSKGAIALAVVSRGSEEAGTDWVDRVIAGWIKRYNPDLVAVDAPSGRGQDPMGKNGRLCEARVTAYADGCWRSANGDVPATDLARFGIARTPREGNEAIPGWMRTGFAVYAALARQGYTLAVDTASITRGQRAAIEVYPDGSFWILAALGSPSHASAQAPRAPLARKRHSPAAAVAADRLCLLPKEIRRRLEQHPDFPSAATARIDFLDAACAAVTGLMALRGAARCMSGRTGEGATWLSECSATGASTNQSPAGTPSPTWVPDGAIRSNPGVLHGKPTIRGTRIAVGFLLELLGGMSKDEVLRDYPALGADDIENALRYAARVLHQERGVRPD